MAKAVVPNLSYYIRPFAHFGTSHSSPTTQTFFSFRPYYTSLREFDQWIYSFSLAVYLSRWAYLRVRTLVWITNEKRSLLTTITWSKSGTRTICCYSGFNFSQLKEAVSTWKRSTTLTVQRIGNLNRKWKFLPGEEFLPGWEPLG